LDISKTVYRLVTKRQPHRKMRKRLEQVLHQKDVQSKNKKSYLRPQVIRGIQIKTMMAYNYYTPTRLIIICGNMEHEILIHC